MPREWEVPRKLATFFFFFFIQQNNFSCSRLRSCWMPLRLDLILSVCMLISQLLPNLLFHFIYSARRGADDRLLARSLYVSFRLWYDIVLWIFKDSRCSSFSGARLGFGCWKCAFFFCSVWCWYVFSNCIVCCLFFPRRDCLQFVPSRCTMWKQLEAIPQPLFYYYY